MNTCARCGKENEPDAETCARCGTRFAEMDRFVAEPQPEPETVCHKHPKVHTALACGKCGQYICPKCVVPSPAGTRCRDCAKSDVVIRPGAILLEFKRFLRTIFSGRYSFFAIAAFLSLVSFMIRSCNASRSAPPMPPVQEQTSDEK